MNQIKKITEKTFKKKPFEKNDFPILKCPYQKIRHNNEIISKVFIMINYNN